MPTIIAAAVISTGRSRVVPAESAASKALMPALRCSRAKVTSRIEFAEATPIAMIAPISEGTLRVVPVTNRMQQNACAGAGQRQDDGQRVEEALIVDDYQHVDEHRGEQQPQRQFAERLSMLPIWPRTTM